MAKSPPAKKTKTRKCPICGRATIEDFKPFCSKSCADADLARWLKGAYAIPGAPAQDDLLDAESSAAGDADTAADSAPKAKN